MLWKEISVLPLISVGPWNNAFPILRRVAELASVNLALTRCGDDIVVCLSCSLLMNVSLLPYHIYTTDIAKAHLRIWNRYVANSDVAETPLL